MEKKIKKKIIYSNSYQTELLEDIDTKLDCLFIQSMNDKSIKSRLKKFINWRTAIVVIVLVNNISDLTLSDLFDILLMLG